MAAIDWDSLGFDAYRTRTLILSHYVNGEWSPIKVTEDFFFTLDPFAQMNHYAISCFEGLKAFRHIGLGDWRIVTAFISGFLAKESVVSTLEVLNVTAALTTLTAIPILLFSLLYTPCVAAIAAIRRELGMRSQARRTGCGSER